MGATLFVVAYVTLRLEITQHGEHRGMGEFVLEPLAHVSNRGRPVISEHFHHRANTDLLRRQRNTREGWPRSVVPLLQRANPFA